MNYEGYRVEVSRKPQQVEEVDGHTLTPEAFFSRFVATRTPVVINGHPSDHSWKASALWDDEYLIKHAGSAKVMVEKRKDPSDTFGKGRKVEMTFAKLVKKLAGGDESLYMTTQQVPVALDGHPALMTTPLTMLADDFESRPSIAGNLVPQQINMWMGNSRSGASSGLHHDFHDNLYILLRGRKQFTLYDPSNAADMYLNGTVQKVHPNGRIVYKGQGNIRADGADEADSALFLARAAAEEAILSAEAAQGRGDQGAADSLAAAEEELERSMEAELDAAFDDEDDFEDADMDAEDEDEGFPGSKRTTSQPISRKQKAGSTESTAQKAAKATAGKSAVTLDSEAPVSFSKVDVALLHPEEISKRFPRFPERGAGLEADLVAGQMLYLPAGWFHEVASYGAEEDDDDGEGSSEDDGSQASPSSCTHLALNYWFHPPDNLRRNGFAQPYSSPFHPTLWASRQRAAEAETNSDRKWLQDALSLVPDGYTNSKDQEDPDAKPQKKQKKKATAAATAADPHESQEGEGAEEECNVGKEIMESLQRDVSKGAIMAAFANWMKEHAGGGLAGLMGGAGADEDEGEGQDPQQGRRKRRRDKRSLGRRHHRPAVCRI